MRKKIGIFGINIDFFAMNVKVIILGIHKGKLKVALNEKRKKLHAPTWVFFFHKHSKF